jgi:hypothetical protein
MCTLPLPQSSPVTTQVPKPESQTLTMRPLAPRSRTSPLRLDDTSLQTQTLSLPKHEVIRVSVVQGLQPDAAFELSRPLVTIGRLGGGADIQIDDSEVSRVHCSIEVRRDAIFLQDLRSTNGTFIGEERIFTARLKPATKFRVGTTVLRLDRSPA